MLIDQIHVFIQNGFPEIKNYRDQFVFSVLIFFVETILWIQLLYLMQKNVVTLIEIFYELYVQGNVTHRIQK